MNEELKFGHRWNEEETILALYLYFQLPFGQLHSKNPEIQSLASAIGRRPSSVAMKLCNFASIDPAIIESGRKGLTGASKLDRATYALFKDDWTKLASRAGNLWAEIISPIEVRRPSYDSAKLRELPATFRFDQYHENSERRALTSQRVGQGFFRRTVLANFDGKCCVTGIADSRLLVASHIKPWTVDKSNRHNPSNGLLLSATLDKAFDRGLITINADKRVQISSQLKNSPSKDTQAYFSRLDNAPISRASRFEPEPAFLDWHVSEIFLDSRG